MSNERFDHLKLINKSFGNLLTIDSLLVILRKNFFLRIYFLCDVANMVQQAYNSVGSVFDLDVEPVSDSVACLLASASTLFSEKVFNQSLFDVLAVSGATSKYTSSSSSQVVERGGMYECIFN